jgi:hypothetical protein
MTDMYRHSFLTNLATDHSDSIRLTIFLIKGLFGTKEYKIEERKKTQKYDVGVIGKQRNGKTHETYR